MRGIQGRTPPAQKDRNFEAIVSCSCRSRRCRWIRMSKFHRPHYPRRICTKVSWPVLK